MSVDVRLARIGDARVLARLCRDELERGLGWHWRAPALARLMARPEVEVAKAEPPEGGLAGFGALELGPDEAELLLLVVQPRHRRRGVGRALLRFLETEALIAGTSTVWLHVRADNAAAIQFYEAAGYRVDGYLRAHYAGRTDALRMRHELGTSAPARRSAEPVDLEGLLRGSGSA